MKRVGKILLFVFLLAAIVAYTVYASILVRQHYDSQKVVKVAVSVADSTKSSTLVTSGKIKELLLKSGMSVINTPTNEVDVVALRKLILRNSFISHLDIYTTYNGTLHIDIEQREPTMRLMVDGYNSYITPDGSLFRAPASGTLYLPVITGRYKPLFPPTFEGNLTEVVDSLRQNAMREIERIEQAKWPTQQRKQMWLDRRDSTRKARVSKSFFETKREFTERRDEFHTQNTKELDRIDGHLRDCNRRLDEFTAQQMAEVEKFEQQIARLDDFRRLMAFVEYVSRNDFWRAEVVQIVASENSRKRIEVELIPRSGDFRLILGDLDNFERKMARAKRTYNELLYPIGWNRYKTINIRYDNQIVCTEE